MKLDIQQIYEAARAAGFTPDQATTWTAIALAESGGETGALNDVGEHSVGLWQINVASDVRSNTWGDLTDPYVNARAAYEISHQGTDMRPWTTTHDSNEGTAHDYRTYLAQVSAVTGYTGDPRGVDGYGAPLPPPLPPSGPTDDTATVPAYDQIDTGMDPAGQLDSDSDGLTDSFERMAGSSPDVADTDQDGLSDAREAVVTGTDALLADTDGDLLTDSTEETLGTSGTTWDTDSDGASDGIEVKHRSNPLLAENGTVPQQDTVAPPVQTTSTMQTAMAGSTMPGSTMVQTGTLPTGTASTLADQFVALAQAQKGDSYVFGTEADLDDADPDSFDCSELTQWAAEQVGVTIPDGAMYQYLELKDQGQLMSVDEALRTKGALLFYFSEEPTPGGSRPGTAHVAISLGDGRTIEARGTSYGVNEFPAEGRFNYAGVIPEMAGSPVGDLAPTAFDATATTTGPDADQDGLSDVFEQMVGLDPMSADSDGDGIDDATEQLGGGTTTTTVAAPPMSEQEVAAALAQQGLDAKGDEDDDGLSNRYEVAHRLDPTLADTDSDGLSDSTEDMLGTSGTSVDTDADGLTDFLEQELGTDPLTRGTPLDRWGLGADEDLAEPPGQEPVETMDADGDL